MQPCLLYVGTEDGLIVLRVDGDARVDVLGRGLAGNAVRGIAIHPEHPDVAYVACGLRGWGLHRSVDAGQRFEELSFADRWVWDVIVDPRDADTLWVGTEPPMLYVSRDDGATFVACHGIEELPSRPRWTFFHPPFHAGHIHGIAMHPEHPERIFAGVEHGALVYSHDGGHTWHERLIGGDLHRIAIDPGASNRVLAGTGAGLLVSEDAGATWSTVAGASGYVHGIAFDPRQAGRVFLYAHSAAGPLSRSDDGGRSWQRIGRELPSAQPADNLTLHPSAPDTLFYAGDADGGGRLFVSSDAGVTWRALAVQLPKVWRMRAAPLPAQPAVSASQVDQADLAAVGR